MVWGSERAWDLVGEYLNLQTCPDISRNRAREQDAVERVPELL